MGKRLDWRRCATVTDEERQSGQAAGALPDRAGTDGGAGAVVQAALDGKHRRGDRGAPRVWRAIPSICGCTALKRMGLAGLEDAPRGGRPPTYTREQVGEIVATALTDPQTLDLPFKSWTLDRLVTYLERAEGHRHEAQPPQRGVADRRLALAQTGDLVWRAGRSRLRAQKGAIEALYVAPPEGSVVVCLDEMGPEAAKSWPGSGWS